MGGLIGKVVQSGKSRLQDKTGQLTCIGQNQQTHDITIPTPQTLRGMGTSSQHNDFWDCLGGQAFLMIGFGSVLRTMPAFDSKKHILNQLPIDFLVQV